MFLNQLPASEAATLLPKFLPKLLPKQQQPAQRAYAGRTPRQYGESMGSNMGLLVMKNVVGSWRRRRSGVNFT